jgi:hypothetical protein
VAAFLAALLPSRNYKTMHHFGGFQNEKHTQASHAGGYSKVIGQANAYPFFSHSAE